jgi:mono/diheme cytochrome c family protein
MRGRDFVLAGLLSVSTVGLATNYGAWLKKVPAADRARVNPYAGNPASIAAGANLFHENCAKCHGNDAEGKGSRPSLRSPEVQNATDGELAWILKNGYVYKGMPRWSGLPEQERWQIISYLRTLPASSAGVEP